MLAQVQNLRQTAQDSSGTTFAWDTVVYADEYAVTLDGAAYTTVSQSASPSVKVVAPAGNHTIGVAPVANPTPPVTLPFTVSGGTPSGGPFADTSIWNTLVNAGAILVPAKLPPRTIRSMTMDMEFPLDDLSQPTLQLTAAGHTYTVHAPANMISSGQANDAYSALLAGGALIEGGKFTRPTAGGPATADAAKPEGLITGDGLTGGLGGSGMSVLGGQIRLGELVKGATEIPHTLKGNLFGSTDLFRSPCYRWPATKCDSYAQSGAGNPAYNGKVEACRMGALLVLPASFNVAGLLSEPGRIIAATLQRRGLYVVNDTSRSVYALDIAFGVDTQFQQEFGMPFVTGLGDTAWAKDVDLIWSQLAVVDNNGPSSIGG